VTLARCCIASRAEPTGESPLQFGCNRFVGGSYSNADNIGSVSTAYIAIAQHITNNFTQFFCPLGRRLSLASRNLELTQITQVPDWLTIDKDHYTGSVSRIPTRDEIAPIVNEQLIVELYSR